MAGFCRNCGNAINDQMTFCAFCGTKIEISPAVSSDDENKTVMIEEETQEQPLPEVIYPSGNVQQAQPQVQSQEQPQVSQIPNMIPVNSQPVYQQTYPVNVPQADKPVKVWKKRNALQIIGSILLSLLLFICLITYLVSNVTKREVVENITSDIISNMDIAGMELGGLAGDLGAQDDTDTLADYIYSNMTQADKDRTGFDAGDIAELLENDEVKEFINKFASGILDGVYDDDGKGLDKDDIIKFVQKEEKTIKKITGYSMSQADYDMMDEYLNVVEFDKFNLNAYEDSVPVDLIRFTISDTFRYILLGVMGVLTLLLLLVNRRAINAAFRAVGIVDLFAGLIVLALSATMVYGVTALSNAFSVSKSILKPIGSAISEQLLVPSLITTGVGIGFIVIGIIVRIIIASVRKKQLQG